MTRSATKLFWGCIASAMFTIVGCAPASHRIDASLRCSPGEDVACACPSGLSGTQRCQYDGTFGVCSCASECVPGRTTSCTCANGSRGSQVCDSNGLFAPCTCSGSTWPDASIADGRGGDATADVPPSAGGTTLASGSSTVIDVFPIAEGIIIVLPLEIRVVSRTGATVRSLAVTREITTAAFDGTLLGVADRGMLTTYNTSLEQVAAGALVEECSSSVTISGSRFVCGANGDWDRVFYVFDMNTATRLSSSMPITYNGQPMRRVPGRDDFVTVTVGTSPSDFYLHRVGADNVVTHYGDSPYHGDFAATTVFAFDRDPADHLIQIAGVQLLIYASACTPTMFRGGCFARDGMLGTLASGQSFAAMADDGAGKLLALVTMPSSPPSYGAPCMSGCLAQRIDLPTQAIETSRTYRSSISRVVATRYDSVSGGLVVAGTTGDTFSATGYVVDLVVP